MKKLKRLKPILGDQAAIKRDFCLVGLLSNPNDHPVTPGGGIKYQKLIGMVSGKLSQRYSSTGEGIEVDLGQQNDRKLRFSLKSTT